MKGYNSIILSNKQLHIVLIHIAVRFALFKVFLKVPKFIYHLTAILWMPHDPPLSEVLLITQ